MDDLVDVIEGIAQRLGLLALADVLEYRNDRQNPVVLKALRGYESGRKDDAVLSDKDVGVRPVRPSRPEHTQSRAVCCRIRCAVGMLAVNKFVYVPAPEALFRFSPKAARRRDS